MKEKHIINNGIDNVPELVLRGEIDGYDAQSIANEIIAQTAKMIRIRINSFGGFVVWAFTVISAMTSYKDAGGTIETINEGRADSAAGWIFACGSKGHRLMMQFAKIFMHPPMFEDGTTIDQLQEGSNERKLLENNFTDLIGIFKGCTGQSETRIKNLMTANTELSASEAVKLNFADKIVEVKNFAELKDKLTARQVINVSTYETQEIDNQIHTDMKKIAIAIGLNAEASESSVHEALTNIINFRNEATAEITNLKAENLKLSGELKNSKQKLSEIKDKEAVEFVNTNYPAKTDIEKKSIVNLYKADSTAFKLIADKTPAHVVIDGNIVETKTETPDKDAEKKADADKFNNMTVSARNELKNSNPSEYSRLVSAYDED